MTDYQIWLSNLGLTEEMAEELDHEDLFHRLNSEPVVIELDKDFKFLGVWTVPSGLDRPVQVYINQEGSQPMFINSPKNPRRFFLA